MSQLSQVSAAPAQFPATPTQSRQWHLERDHGDALSKNIAVQWELRGSFSEASVEAAFNAVFRRHEILRTAFAEEDGTVVQRVHEDVPFHLGSIDLRSLSQEDCEDRIRAIAVEMAAEPFNMAAPGQLRATLVRFAPERAMLLIATHYGVFDGFSIKVLGREIGTLIAAAESGTAPDLPELTLQFGDYALWREACATSGAMDEARAYWHRKLEGWEYFEIPTDRPRLPGPRSGTTLKLPLPQGFRDDLERAAKSLGSSPFALGAAVMAAALHAVTGRADVGFTTCVAGREEAEFEDLIGVFVNPVVLQFDCAGASVKDLIGKSRRVVAEALGHGDLPIDDLAEELGQPLDPNRTPFVSPFFSLQSVFVEEQDYGPVRIVSVPSHTPQVSHDLALQVIGRDSGWHMIIDYDTGLFDEATVRAFADVVEKGFAAAFEAPNRAAASLAAPRVAVAATPAAKTAPAQSAPARSAPARSARATDDSTRALQSVWSDVLGRTPDAPDVDFFELGGHSLAALKMLARVEAATGARIDIGDFFDDPTLGGLAARVDAALGRTAPAAEDDSWSVIGLRSAPDTAPLIVSINQPFLYHGMAKALPAEAEVINLHIKDANALDGSDAQVLDRLVSSAVDCILARAGERPLHLIGHCVDGTLALLIATGLTDAGKEPEQVAMIDCWNPHSNAGLSPARLRARRLGAKARRWGQNLRQLVRREIGPVEFLSRNKISRPLLERLGRIDTPTAAEEREWAINARLVHLVRSMTPRPYSGRVTLFSTGGQYPDARARLFGWSEVLPADTPIHDLPGWHEYALKSHGTGRIAAVLGCRLGRAVPRG